MAEDAYVTMLFTDSYLQGALVLAASLRDGNTSKKLAVIVPGDEAHRLRPETITQLEGSFDYVISMPTLATGNYSNLRLLDRPDLALTLTKVNLWRLTQFRKCVYLDADILALRAPDELFDLDVDFAAAPDVGWPDIFNSGVFLFKPNMGTYYALKTLAESGITFDGGDQGLLNTFFPAYHRLSFTYNVTPSTNYQYAPAYRHFQSNISLFHFIGKSKPWSQRGYSGESNNEATGRWWSVYEKHFGWKIREDELRRNQEKAIQGSQETTSHSRSAEPYHRPTEPYQRPTETYHRPTEPYQRPTEPYQRPTEPYQQSTHPILSDSNRPSSADKTSKHVSFGSTDTTFFHSTAPPPQMSSQPSYEAPPMERQSPPPFEPKIVTWDPARSAPPADSGPEAKDLSVGAYQSAWDKPYNPNEPKWVPPPRTPLPKGYEYTPPAPPPESHDTSSDSEDEETPVAKSTRFSTSGSDTSEGKEDQQPQEHIPAVFPWEMRGPRPNATRVFPGDEATKSPPKAPEARPYDRRASLDRYEFTNAWDSLPIIQGYVRQKLGETPEPISTRTVPKVESPSISSAPKNVLAISTVSSATEGERWDPNKQLDKLKSGVITKLREQQQKRSPTLSKSIPGHPRNTEEEAEEFPPNIDVDDGN